MQPLINNFVIFSSILFILVLSSSIYALPRHMFNHHKFHHKKHISDIAKITENNEFKTLYYPQTLDHFNYQEESYKIFKQKYVINLKYWGGANSKAPILVYFGDESSLDDFIITNGTILKKYGQHFKGLLLFIEHRFYGESIPFGMSMEKVMKNTRIRGYFSSAQAIADCAELILYVKQKYKAHYSPVIVFGGSYGGMLATWFRLKYPHIAIGALASSAPILYFDNIIPPNHGYYSVITKDFKETSQSCFETIRDSWMMIDKIGQEPNGLSILSKKFNTCSQFKNIGDLKKSLDYMYCYVAHFNFPSIKSICDAIDDKRYGTDVLGRIYAATLEFFPSNDDTPSCQELRSDVYTFNDTILGWDWQKCSEMVMPIVYGTSKDSMFPHETFNLTKYIKECKDKYNVVPRPHWITTYYGGYDLKLILKSFGSNIIFSNGLQDPYSSAGVLENLSDSLIAVYTTQGTHAKDLMEPEADDPEWLVHQRKREVELMEGWLKQYYRDLKLNHN